MPLSGCTCVLNRWRVWWKSVFFFFPWLSHSLFQTVHPPLKENEKPLSNVKSSELQPVSQSNRCWQVVLHLLIEFAEKRQHRETGINAREGAKKAELWQRWTWWGSSNAFRSQGEAVDHLCHFAHIHPHTRAHTHTHTVICCYLVEQHYTCSTSCSQELVGYQVSLQACGKKLAQHTAVT